MTVSLLQPTIYNLQPKNGFTLLEVVVMVSLLVLLFVVVMGTLAPMIRNIEEFSVARSINKAAHTGIERITRDIRNATAVDTLASTFGAHPGKLVLTVPIGGTPTTFTYEVTGGQLTVQAGAGAAVPLTDTDVTIDALIFRSITTAHSQAVRTELTLSSTKGRASETESFTVTTVARGSY